MDTNVPSQLDEADLSAELELEIPDSQETPLMLDSGEEIEIVEEDDGSVLVDFDPSEDMADVGFDENLAEVMEDRELGAIASELMGEFDANKASRQEWEDAYTEGLELLGFNYQERTEPFRGASGVIVKAQKLQTLSIRILPFLTTGLVRVKLTHQLRSNRTQLTIFHNLGQVLIKPNIRHVLRRIKVYKNTPVILLNNLNLLPAIKHQRSLLGIRYL
jgi:hypothetical protein